MTQYLSAEEYQTLQAQVREGISGIDISGSVSRQFFTRVPNAEIIEKTGRSVIIPKIVVWSALLLSPMLLVATFVFIFTSNSALIAAFTIPLIGIFWTIIAAFMNPEGDWLSLTLVLFITLISLFLASPGFAIPLFLFVFSLWLHRLVHIFARIFLKDILLDSYAAYDMLVEHIVIKRSNTDPSSV